MADTEEELRVKIRQLTGLREIAKTREVRRAVEQLIKEAEAELDRLTKK